MSVLDTRWLAPAARAVALGVALQGTALAQNAGSPPRNTSLGTTAQIGQYTTPPANPQAIAPLAPDQTIAPQPSAWSADTFRKNREQGAMADSVTRGELDGVVDLGRAWRLTVSNDPTYQAAFSALQASQTQIAQGRAALLPQVRAGYNRYRITGTRRTPGRFGETVESPLDYDSTGAVVQLQQPVLNYGRYAAYLSGLARAGEGRASFDVRAQETGVRLATAYFNVLLAHHDLELQRNLVDSLRKQLHAQQTLYKGNEGTLIDAQETQARLAMAEAGLILADDELRVTTRNLQAMLGAQPLRLTTVKEDFPTPALMPGALDDWLARARQNNAQVRAAREAVRVADANVDSAASQYFPTVDFVATYNDADSENLSTLSQRSNTVTLGLRMNIPIFTGGYTTAATSQARSERKRTESMLAAITEQVEAEVTRQFTAVQGGVPRIQAYASAVKAGTEALVAAQQGYKFGAYSNLDVLKVQDKLFQSKYDLMKAQLEYVLARLQLAMAVGDLQDNVFDQVGVVFLGPVVPLLQPVQTQ